MENYYQNGRVKVILANEENAYETEVFEMESREEAIGFIKDTLVNNYFIEEEDVNEVPESRNFTSGQGYHIIMLIVENEREEEFEIESIEEEWRQPMIDEIEDDECDIEWDED